MPSAWVIRRGASDGPRYRVLFRAGGKESPQTYAGSFRTMRGVGWKQKHFALFDGNIYGFSVFLYPHIYVALKLVEQLFSFVEVKILSCIWTTNDHDYVIAGVSIKVLIPNRRF